MCDIEVKTDDDVREAVKKLCFLKDDDDDDDENIKLSRVSGGITNTLYRASFGFGDKIVLVRIFGAEGMIDRKKENATFQFLGEQGVAPKYCGGFRNGRLEQWLDGYEALELDDLSCPKTSGLIARALARLHSLSLPDYLKKTFYSKGSGLWNQLESWYVQAKGRDTAKTSMSEDRTRMYSEVKFKKIGEIIKKIKKIVVESLSGDVRLCHNDVLYGNIMRHTKTGSIQLIDFEYGDMNYISFDIANHFNEWAGGTGTEKTGPGYAGVPDYTRLPSSEQRERFCREYLDERGDLSGDSEKDRAVVKELLQEVDLFRVVNDIYWGLWGLNQAFEEGCDEFDYMLYGTTRLKTACCDDSRVKK